MPFGVPWRAAAAAALVTVAGVLGLVGGATAQPGGGPGSAQPAQPIVVTGAYVRQPAPPTDAAAAYFTVRNNTDQPDTLLSVTSGAGRSTTLHTGAGGRMSELTDGAVIPAHGSLVLSVGQEHVMIEQLFGPLEPGQTVNLELQFRTAGTIDVSAPVVGLLAPAPTATSGASK